MDRIDPAALAVIGDYARSLRKLGVVPTKIILYGSHATGNAGPLSDIDILIESPDFARVGAAERPWLIARANHDLRASIQVIDVAPEELAKASPLSFLREILRTGVELPLASIAEDRPSRP